MSKKKKSRLGDVIMRSYYLQFNKVQFLQCDLDGPLKTLIHDKWNNSYGYTNNLYHILCFTLYIYIYIYIIQDIILL